MIKETVLYIKDMDCEDEAKLVRSALGGLKGIERYEINLISHLVRIAYDSSLLSIENILIAIAKTGLEVSLKKEKLNVGVWWKEPRILTLSICGLLIFINLIFEHLFRIPHGMAVFLYAAAVLIGGYYPAKMGLSALLTLSPNIRTLMVAGAAGAIALGLWEEAALLVLIYSLGDVLEAFASDRVRNAVRALMDLAPNEALVRRNGAETLIPLDDVKIGEIMIIKPGQKIPLDGKVLSGSSSVDQAPITGESIPVEKQVGDEVFAGSINQRGTMEVETTKPFEDTTLGKIIHYVEEAEARKSSFQRFGETFGRYYTPLMFALSILVMTFPPLFFGNWADWFYRGLVVLVVSCSCGIALSIPVSIVAAISNAARHGVLIKGGTFMEIVGEIKAIAFDKTGSLTAGRPVVTDMIPFGELKEKDLLSMAASIESRSEHVLAEAILNKAKERNVIIQKVEDFAAIPGQGATAKINNEIYCIGSKTMCSRLGVLTAEAANMITALEEKGKTVIALTGKSQIIGIIAARDELRPGARASLDKLKGVGIKSIVMLTGDNNLVAKAMADEVGIDEYMAQLLPEEKVGAVKTIRGRHGMTAMVGDGVNDTPAMVASDLGIAMGAVGTDVAIETGDIILMSDNLLKLPYVIDLGRRTVRNIKANIIISLLIIGFLVPMALLGQIGLVPGLLINELGGLLVIINGLRLLK